MGAEILHDDLLIFNYYDCFRLDRKVKSRGGGLLTLVRKSGRTSVTMSDNWQMGVSNEDAEIQTLMIKFGNIRKILLLNCYRPPSGNIDSFLSWIYIVYWTILIGLRNMKYSYAGILISPTIKQTQ